MPAITPQILAIAKDARCNVFVESGTYKGTSFRRALESGIFERCYTVEIVPELYSELASQYPEQPNQRVFLGRSHEVFAEQVFPLCSPEDRTFFWLDGHFSKGDTGGADFPCPLLDELEAIRRYCPTNLVVIAIDDTDDLGRSDPEVPGLNWPTRDEVEAAAYRINPHFFCLDYTGASDTRKIFRGVLVFSYRRPKIQTPYIVRIIDNLRVIDHILNIRHYLHHLRAKWIEPVLPTKRLWRSFSLYVRYLSDWFHYSHIPNSETLHFLDSHPCLFERTTNTPFDAHYFYQDLWAFKRIQQGAPSFHVDVGSRAILAGMLTAITQVFFVDIRPLLATLDNFLSIPGSILAMPFNDNSIPSLSCLHVAEHIGLGRYGDPLDPEGTKKAIRELARVLAPGGNLYFSLPVGKCRVCFNAHRIHSPRQILDYFHDLKLLQFSGIDDGGLFRQGINPADLANSNYACGLFHFTK